MISMVDNKLKYSTSSLRRYLTGCFVFICMVMVFAVLAPSVEAKSVKNTKKLCLSCHSDAGKFLNKSNVHEPVRLGKCTVCHSPHASKHSGLTASEGKRLCETCHKSKEILKGKVVHEPVAKGECLVCHDPHSGEGRGLLKERGSKSCFTCHPKDELIAGKVVHPKVKAGKCLACHAAHSSGNDGLLIKERGKLCEGCHSAKTDKLKRAHSGFKVAGTDCVSCHSPHSSDNASLVGANMHAPFAEKNCDACHKGKSKALKVSGTKLCTECHASTLPSFNKVYSHMSAGDSANMCVDCHNSHASDRKNLMKGKESKVCYACHEATEESLKAYKYKHVDADKCSNCHVSHGSDYKYFLSKGADTCSTANCHPVQGTFTHPVGEGVIDPRSQDPMDCTTCHTPMGADHDPLLRLDKIKDICEQCHQI
ncbi:MAG: hypothetical protein KAS88_00570 [Deltaproteobacteria bacterium]|nr:hypothetical protein [Deltaproteobacteria bacterium]